jgi:DNA-binding winged helix-turn-helix (wHTH) protein
MAARFSSFELDPQRRQLLREGQVLHLTPKAFDLISLLVEAAPRVVPKSEIHQRLWPAGVVTDATLVGLIKELRRALLDTDADKPIIRTAHRVGYAFDAPVAHTAATSHDRHWLIARDTRFALSDGENVIGRDPAANVWLDHATISRRHARVVIRATHAILEDLGSKNGTSIRGIPLTGAAALANGDEFSCGQLIITYRQSSAELPTATQMSRAGDPPDRR